MFHILVVLLNNISIIFENTYFDSVTADLKSVTYSNSYIELILQTLLWHYRRLFFCFKYPFFKLQSLKSNYKLDQVKRLRQNKNRIKRKKILPYKKKTMQHQCNYWLAFLPLIFLFLRRHYFLIPSAEAVYLLLVL